MCVSVCMVLTTRFMLSFFNFFYQYQAIASNTTVIFFFFYSYNCPGIVGLLVLIPANAHVMGLLRRTQTGQLVCKDHRIKLVNEILNGVKVKVKLNLQATSF